MAYKIFSWSLAVAALLGILVVRTEAVEASDWLSAGGGELARQEVKAKFLDPVTQVGPLDLLHYHLTFEDDFKDMDVVQDGQTGRWYGPLHWRIGAAEFSPPSKDGPFIFENGHLIIRATKTNERWRSGLMQTVDSHGRGFAQKFGYFEIRAKLPNGSGTWSAFWLLTLNGITDPTKTVGEIDPLEHYGDDPARGYLSLNLWPHGGEHWYVTRYLPINRPTGLFHRYGVMVDERYITYYIDGMPMIRVDTLPEFKEPLYIVLDLTMKDLVNLLHLTPEGHGLKYAISPADFVIDYVRVYAAN